MKPTSDTLEINEQVDNIFNENGMEELETPTSDTEIVDVTPVEENAQVEVVEDVNNVEETTATGLTPEELSDAVEIGE